MPATRDGRCWACVQRRRSYDDGEIIDMSWVEGSNGLRHLVLGDRQICSLPRRGRSRDPEVVREYNRRYAAKKTDAYLAKRRRQHLRRHYRMSVEEFEALAESQGGLCACCKTAPIAHVDHDHETGRVRGLLCAGCNLMIGHAGEDPDRLRAGVSYLLMHRTDPIDPRERANNGPANTDRHG